MRSIWIVASNTFREIIRDRILYALIIFALLLMALSVILGLLSFDEQIRISVDLGMTGIHLSSVFLSIFVGSALVHKEMEKRTVMTLLARPLNRGAFLIGKFFGMGLVLLVVVLGLAAVLGLMMMRLGAPMTSAYPLALSGIIFEALVLLAAVLFFGSFMKPVLGASMALSVFLIGHWIPDLSFFKGKSSSDGFKLMVDVVSRVFPNFEKFNWRSAVTYSDPVPLADWSSSFVYALAWMVVLVFFSNLIFKRRDLG